MGFWDRLRNWRTIAQPVQQPKFDITKVITEADSKRLQRYGELRDFYDGRHFEHCTTREAKLITMNYCKPFVDKSAAFLLGKSFDIVVPKRLGNVTLDVLNETWRVNKKDVIAVEMAQNGGVTGDCFVKVIYDANKRIVELVNLDPAVCFPEYDEMDIDKLVKFRIIYTINGGKDVFEEIISNDSIVEQVNGEVIDTRPNPLGEIPIVHIKNLPKANSYWGVSDLQDVIPLNKVLNEKLTDVSDIIDYHAAPVTLIFGAVAKQLQKGARKIWSGLPKDAKVENLELTSDLGASNKFLEAIKLAMHEIANIPEGSLGKFQAVSNTSGVALHMQYQPLMEKTRLKQLNYSLGIQEINRLILRTYEVFRKFKFPFLRPYESSVVFGDPLPKDELIQRQVFAQDVNMGITSRKQVMRELGWSESEIKTMQKEIDAERMFDIEAEAVAGAPYGAAGEDVGGVDSGIR